MLKKLIYEFSQIAAETKDDLLQKSIIAEKISNNFSFALFYSLSNEDFCSALEAFLFAGAITMGVTPVVAAPLSRCAARTFCMLTQRAKEEMEGFDD